MTKNFFLSVSVAVLLSLSGCGGGGEASNNPDFIIVVTGDSSK